MAAVISDEAAALYGRRGQCATVATRGAPALRQVSGLPIVFRAAKLTPTAEKLLDWRAGSPGSAA